MYYLLVLVDKRRMISSAMRLSTVWPQLIPVTFLHVVAVGFNGAQVQRLGHIERLLFFDGGRAAETVRAVAGGTVLAVLHHGVQAGRPMLRRRVSSRHVSYQMNWLAEIC